VSRRRNSIKGDGSELVYELQASSLRQTSSNIQPPISREASSFKPQAAGKQVASTKLRRAATRHTFRHLPCTFRRRGAVPQAGASEKLLEFSRIYSKAESRLGRIIQRRKEGGPWGAGAVPSYPGRQTLGYIDVSAVPSPLPGRTGLTGKVGGPNHEAAALIFLSVFLIRTIRVTGPSQGFQHA